MAQSITKGLWVTAAVLGSLNVLGAIFVSALWKGVFGEVLFHFYEQYNSMKGDGTITTHGSNATQTRVPTRLIGHAEETIQTPLLFIAAWLLVQGLMLLSFAWTTSRPPRPQNAPAARAGP